MSSPRPFDELNKVNRKIFANFQNVYFVNLGYNFAIFGEISFLLRTYVKTTVTRRPGACEDPPVAPTCGVCLHTCM